DLVGLGVVAGDLVVVGDGGAAAQSVDDRVRLVAQRRAEIAVLLRLHVIEHPVLFLAGDDVDQAALLVGGDVDHTLPLLLAGLEQLIGQRHGHAEVLCLVGGGVVGHHVAALVDGDLVAALEGLSFGCGGVALLGAEVDLAGGADEVAGVDLGLGGVAGGLGRQADERVRVQPGAALVGLVGGVD